MQSAGEGEGEDTDAVIVDNNTPGADPGLLEDDIRQTQTLDTIHVINSLKLTVNDFSRMKIPLCRLVPMPMLRPTLASDIVLLENQFVRGYEEGARVFYVSIADEEGNTQAFSDEEKEEWGPIWNSVNDRFNLHLKGIPQLKHLIDQKFYVCDGNHRRIAWMNHITRLHSADRNWHVCVDSIVLDTRQRIGAAMQAMHDINKYMLSPSYFLNECFLAH